MDSDIKLIRKDLHEIKVEIDFIKNNLLDDEFGFEISDEVVEEVKKSRKDNGKDLISHEEVFKKYCK